MQKGYNLAWVYNLVIFNEKIFCKINQGEKKVFLIRKLFSSQDLQTKFKEYFTTFDFLKVELTSRAN